MSESTPSPMKQKIKSLLGIGNTDGEDDPKEPPSTPKNPKRKRVSSGDQRIAKKLVLAQERYPNPGTLDLPESPRNPRMFASNALAFVNPDKIHILGGTPARETVNHYQATETQFEDWMANTNPTGPACPVVQSTLTLDDLIKGNPPRKPEFDVWEVDFVAPPAEIRGTLKSAGLPHDTRAKNYRYSKMNSSETGRKVSSYEHYILQGAIIVKAVYRKKRGPQWNDIALALYKHEAAIDTLRYVYYTTVENKETQPLVGKVLYNNLPGPGSGPEATFRIWRMHTPEFQQILGTKLGRATSRLVLAAWPRGTHQIPRINTWFLSGSLHMRFDIEPIARASPHPSQPSHPSSPTTPTPSSRRPRRSGSGAA